MARPPLLVRLVQGNLLPVPPDEGVDGTVVMTPESGIVRVRDSSWARRRILRGDFAVVEEERFETMQASPAVTARMRPIMADPTPELDPVPIDLDLDSLAAEIDLETDILEDDR